MENRLGKRTETDYPLVEGLHLFSRIMENRLGKRTETALVPVLYPVSDRIMENRLGKRTETTRICGLIRSTLRLWRIDLVKGLKHFGAAISSQFV